MSMSTTVASASKKLLLSLAVVLLLLAALTAAADNCAAVTEDPLASVDYTSPTFLACTKARCQETLGIDITSGASGYCNGNATAEADVDCSTIASAYSTFYSCVQRSLMNTSIGSSTYQSELTIYYNTPGVPYTFTNLPCYACNHFKNEVLAVNGSSCSTMTCTECCAGQSPFATTKGNLGKGYNAVLCGNGCITALMMIPFTFVSFLMFICCCCNWPSPALKSTAARVKAEEEEAERALRHPHGSDVEKDQEEEEEETAEERHSSHHSSSNKQKQEEEEKEEREPFHEEENENENKKRDSPHEL